MDSLLTKHSADRMFHRLLTWGAAAASMLLWGCQTSPDSLLIPSPSAVVLGVTPSPASSPKASQPPNIQPEFAYTYQRPDGNRYIQGRGQPPDFLPRDIPLDGAPVWVVGAPYQDGSLWVAVLEDGQVQAFYSHDQSIEPFAIQPAQLVPNSPPLLRVSGAQASLVAASSYPQSNFSHPVEMADGSLVLIDQTGNLIEVQTGGESRHLPLQALPDSRLLQNDSKSLLLYNGATDRYDHGVLGDGIEASQITRIDFLPYPEIGLVIQLEDPNVFEGIFPIWTDLDGDGQPELIATISDHNQGARLIIYNAQGAIIASSSSIGQGYRWRHAIAAAPFGPNGEIEVVDVLTPHLNGVVEFFRLNGQTLELVAQISGYTSHILGRRNLDMTAAADFDGDGQVEVLVPNRQLTGLAGIRHAAAGAEVAWQLDLQGQLNSNLALVALADKGMALGVGLTDNRLQLWLP